MDVADPRGVRSHDRISAKNVAAGGGLEARRRTDQRARCSRSPIPTSGADHSSPKLTADTDPPLAEADRQPPTTDRRPPTTDGSPKLTADAAHRSPKLTANDREILKNASYTCIFRFDNTIKTNSNADAKISKSGKSVMLKLNMLQLATGQKSIANKVTLQ